MTRRKRQGKAPTGKHKSIDLADIGTNETPTGATRVGGGASTEGGASRITEEMTLQEYAGLRKSPSWFQNLDWKDGITIASIVAGTVGVVWAAFLIQFGVDDIEEKVDSVSTTVSEIKGAVEQNEIRLDTIGESVSEVRREVGSTKDAVNELRVETAQQDNNKGDE